MPAPAAVVIGAGVIVVLQAAVWEQRWARTGGRSSGRGVRADIKQGNVRTTRFRAG